MKLVIINGSIQSQNGSSIHADLIQRTAGDIAKIVSIEPFSELFRGEYIYFSNATPDQAHTMQTIAEADALIFVVPTYFKSLPGSLKNFYDIVRERSLYEHKAIAFLASNHKNQDFGARHAMLIVQGILEFFETQAVFVPEIAISNPESPDDQALAHVIDAVTELHNSYHP